MSEQDPTTGQDGRTTPLPDTNNQIDDLDRTQHLSSAHAHSPRDGISHTERELKRLQTRNHPGYIEQQQTYSASRRRIPTLQQAERIYLKLLKATQESINSFYHPDPQQDLPNKLQDLQNEEVDFVKAAEILMNILHDQGAIEELNKVNVRAKQIKDQIDNIEALCVQSINGNPSQDTNHHNPKHGA